MYKIITSVGLFLIIVTTSFSQTNEGLSQADKNKQKVAELREKLNHVTMDSADETQNQDSVSVRLGRLEEQMTLLLTEIQSLKAEQLNKRVYFNSPSGDEQIDAYTVLKKMDLFLEGKTGEMLIQKKKSENIPIHSIVSNVNKLGDFYIIVESQHTLELIKKAKEMYLNKTGENVVILHNLVSGWYYLSQPNALKHSQVLNQLNKHRKAGLENAWWVSTNDVELL